MKTVTLLGGPLNGQAKQLRVAPQELRFPCVDLSANGLQKLEVNGSTAVDVAVLRYIRGQIYLPERGITVLVYRWEHTTTDEAVALLTKTSR